MKLDKPRSEKMKTVGLPMTAWEVQKMMNNEKTQVHKLWNLQVVNVDAEKWVLSEIEDVAYLKSKIFTGLQAHFQERNNRTKWFTVKCPWQVGEKIWIRESYVLHSQYDSLRPGALPDLTYLQQGVTYLADIYNGEKSTWMGKTRSPMFMPRWASRPERWEIVKIGCERVGEISEEDCIAEGIEPKEPNHVVSARSRWAQLWNSLHAAPKIEKWNLQEKVGYLSFPFSTEDGDLRGIIKGIPHHRCVNPWSWVLKFKRLI